MLSGLNHPAKSRLISANPGSDLKLRHYLGVLGTSKEQDMVFSRDFIALTSILQKRTKRVPSPGSRAAGFTWGSVGAVE
jgi:hypothetical protein